MPRFSQLVILWLAAYFTLASGELLRGTSDELAVTGSTVTLHCSTNLSIPVQWEFKSSSQPPGESGLLVYSGCTKAVINNRFLPRYSVTVNTTRKEHMHALVIHPLQSGDAGTYRCIDDCGGGGHKHKEGIPNHEYSAELVVTEKLLCWTNVNDGQSSNQSLHIPVGYSMKLNCTLYSVTGNIAPTFRWSVIKPGSMSEEVLFNPEPRTVSKTEGLSQTIVSEVQFKITESLNGTVVRCNTLFNHKSSINFRETEIYQNLNWVTKTLLTTDTKILAVAEASVHSGMAAVFIFFGILIGLVAMFILIILMLKRAGYKMKLSSIVTFFIHAKQIPTRSTSDESEPLNPQPELKITETDFDQNQVKLKELIDNYNKKIKDKQLQLSGTDSRQFARQLSDQLDGEKIDLLDEQHKLIISQRSNLFQIKSKGDSINKNLGNKLGKFKAKMDETEKKVDESLLKKQVKFTIDVLQYQSQINLLPSRNARDRSAKSEKDLIERSTKLHSIQQKEVIQGITVVDDKIFIVRFRQQQVNVFTAGAFDSLEDIDVSTLKYPQSIAGCSLNKVLYISDSEKNCIHRVSIDNQNVSTFAEVDHQNVSTFAEVDQKYVPLGLSVTSRQYLLITAWKRETVGESLVLKYNNLGEMVREITLDRNINYAWHTVALPVPDDQFIICHGLFHNDVHRICRINLNNEILKSYGSNEGEVNVPYSIALNQNEIFVADIGNNRVLKLDFELNSKVLDTSAAQLKIPTNLVIDPDTNALLVSDEVSSGVRKIILSNVKSK